MITAKDIQKNYGDLQVLKGVTLEIDPGEIISIMGASGAGKTTFLQILGTLDRPNGGTISYDGIEISRLGEREQARFRNQNIGFVFQFHHLLPEFTALENVCIPGYIKGRKVNELQTDAKNLLDRLGLSGRLDHKPNQLSGGEQQRVAIARALINSPKVVLMDEPTGNLDSKNAEEIHQLVLSLREELNQTFVLVTHNKELAELADRKLEMKDGRIL